MMNFKWIVIWNLLYSLCSIYFCIFLEGTHLMKLLWAMCNITLARQEIFKWQSKKVLFFISTYFWKIQMNLSVQSILAMKVQKSLVYANKTYFLIISDEQDNKVIWWNIKKTFAIYDTLNIDFLKRFSVQFRTWYWHFCGFRIRDINFYFPFWVATKFFIHY